MKLLIGYDGSESADHAIQELKRAGLPAHVEAIVLSVADLPTEVPVANYGSRTASGGPLPPIVALATRESAARVVIEAQEAAQKGAELVRALFPTWKIGFESLVDSPSWAIVRRAEEASVDLVVVGSHGKTGLQRLALGSVSENVVRHAHCSVLVARGDSSANTAKGAPVQLLVGVDGSVQSALAVSAIASRTWPVGTRVEVIAALDFRFWAAIVNYGSTAWDWIGQGADDENSWARNAVEAVAEELCAAGLVATAFVQEGNPKHVLVEEAKRLSADCIFVGAKGYSRVQRLLIGSVSSSVVATASCSVEIVRQG